MTDSFIFFSLSPPRQEMINGVFIYFFGVVLLVVDRSGPAIPAGDFGKMFFRILISLSPRSNFLNIPMVIFFYGLNEVVDIETLRRATRREFVFLCRVFSFFFSFSTLLE
jgi:hypothetical protein